MTGARRRVPLRSTKTPIGSVDPYALKIPARRAECGFTKPHCLHSPPSSIRGVAPPGPPKWLPPPPPLTGTVPDASFESRDRQAVFVVKGVADAVEQCKGGKVPGTKLLPRSRIRWI